MRAKILLCFVLLFNLVGNTALAAPSSPPDQTKETSENKPIADKQTSTSKQPTAGKTEEKTTEKKSVEQKPIEQQTENNTQKKEETKKFDADNKTNVQLVKKQIPNLKFEPHFAGGKKLIIEPYQNCDNFDFGCKLNRWMYDSAKNGLEGISRLLNDGGVFSLSNITDNPTVNQFYQYFKELSWTFVLVFLLYQSVRILSLLILQEDHSELKSVLYKVVIAACLIKSQDWICDNLFKLSLYFTETYRGTVNTLPEKLINANTGSNYFLIVVFSMILFVLCMVICVQTAILTAEFALLFIVGPIVIATIVNREMNFFPRWWRNILSVLFSQSLQVLSIAVVTNMLVNNSVNFLVCIGFLVLITRIPSLLNNWLQADSLATTAASGVVRYVTNVHRKATQYTFRNLSKLKS